MLLESLRRAFGSGETDGFGCKCWAKFVLSSVGAMGFSWEDIQETAIVLIGKAINIKRTKEPVHRFRDEVRRGGRSSPPSAPPLVVARLRPCLAYIFLNLSAASLRKA